MVFDMLLLLWWWVLLLFLWSIRMLFLFEYERYICSILLLFFLPFWVFYCSVRVLYILRWRCSGTIVDWYRWSGTLFVRVLVAGRFCRAPFCPLLHSFAGRCSSLPPACRCQFSWFLPLYRCSLSDVCSTVVPGVVTLPLPRCSFCLFGLIPVTFVVPVPRCRSSCCIRFVVDYVGAVPFVTRDWYVQPPYVVCFRGRCRYVAFTVRTR